MMAVCGSGSWFKCWSRELQTIKKIILHKRLQVLVFFLHVEILLVYPYCLLLPCSTCTFGMLMPVVYILQAVGSQGCLLKQGRWFHRTVCQPATLKVVPCVICIVTALYTLFVHTLQVPLQLQNFKLQTPPPTVRKWPRYFITCAYACIIIVVSIPCYYAILPFLVPWCR